MKNIMVYYLTIIIPLATLVLLMKGGEITSTAFTILILIYGLLYHPYISGRRLIDLAVIEKSNFYKNFIPLWNFRFFSKLFFGR